MLGKLFKYEMKASGRVLLPIFAATIALSAIVAFMPPYTRIKQDSIILFAKTITELMFVIFIGVSIGFSFFASALRFKNNILGAEGYLMNTLPVSPLKNVAAKLISAVIYQFASLAVVYLCWEITIKFDNVGYLLENIPKVLAEMDTFLWIDNIFFCLFVLLITVLFNVAVYAALSVGHSFNSHKIIVSIAVFLLLFFVGSNVFSFICYIIPTAQYNTAGYILNDVIYLACAVIYNIIGLFITNYFLKNRLNLE